MQDALTNDRLSTYEDLLNLLSERADVDEVRRVASMRKVLRSSVFVEGYVPSEGWINAVAFTNEGDRIRCELTEANEYSPAEIAMGIFIALHGRGLLVDAQKSDLVTIRLLISDDIKANKILVPGRSGRELYDRYNESHPGLRAARLPATESLSLLLGANQGVHQIGRYVTGPLGLIEVSPPRFQPPSRELPLWHCADVGCRTVHEVFLESAASPVHICAEEISDRHLEAGLTRMWSGVLLRLIDEDDLTRERYSYSDVMLLIGDAFHGAERRILLKEAVAGPARQDMRELINSCAGKVARRIEDFVEGLDDQSVLQVLHGLSDSGLASLIDRCLTTRAIVIPPSEVRESRFALGPFSSKVSSLGIRFTGSNPLLDMCAVILDAYESTGRSSELEWHLRSQSGQTGMRSALLRYLAESDPLEAVNKLILSVRDIAGFSAAKLGCQFDDPGNPGLSERILWKFGFNLPRYGQLIADLRRRLEHFNTELLSVAAVEDERARERVRSAGVNVFVSIEEFLQELIRYNVWLLGSDHLIDTGFQYDPDNASDIVITLLGGSIKSGEALPVWSRQGENTLGVLLAYLNAMSAWIRSLVSADRTSFERKGKKLPHYASDEYRFFPFGHVQLWADADYSALKRFSDLVESVRSRVARSNLAAIRNGLDHHRGEDRFPDVDSMLAFVALFREAIDLADVNLLFPKEYWIKGWQKDRFGRRSATYTDYRGRDVVLDGPSPTLDLPLRLDVEEGILIAPGNLFSVAGVHLTFRQRKKSAYTEYWCNYPPKPVDPVGEIQRIGAEGAADESQDLAP